MIRIGWNKRLGCQLALAVAFGILLAEGGGLRSAFPALLLLSLLLAPLLREQKRGECAARLAMLMLAGGLAAVSFLVQDARWRRQEQALCTGQEQTIRGVLVHKEIKNGRWRLFLSLPDNENQILVSTKECAYPSGSVLLVTGTLRGFGFPRNEGQFNEKTYYKSRQVIGQMRAEKMVCEHAPRGVFLWREQLYRLRTAIAGVCNSMLPADEAGILAAMLAGEKSLLDGEVYALFQRTGIGHILAISGMHVSILGMGMYSLLRKCGAGYPLCAGLTGLLLYGYGTMAGMGVSTKRALCMFFVYLLAQCLGRGYDARAALGVTAAVFLVHRPFLLHSVGFQFSFVSAYAVVAVGALLKQEDENKKRRLVCALRPLLAAFLLQLWILPLTAYYNYELPLCALFLNLLLLPYAGVTMGFGLAGCGAVLAGGGGAWTGLARLLFVPCRMVLCVYIQACRAAELLPFSGVVCGRPSEGKLAVYYGLFALLLFVYAKRAFRRASGGRETAGMHVRLCVGGILLLLFLCHAKKGGFEVSFLDVGQGDGAFIRTSEGVACFVDGGSSDVSGVGTYRILPFLKSKGISGIDYWLLSHLDEDHVSGFYEVMESGYPIGAVVAAQACVHDGAWERLEDSLEAHGIRMILVRAGDVMQLHNPEGAALNGTYKTGEPEAAAAGQREEGGASISVLAPAGTETASDDRNAESLVCLYEENGFRALFTGDIGAEQEARLLEDAGWSDGTLSDGIPEGGAFSDGMSSDGISSDGTFPGGQSHAIDVYKAPHHGSGYSSSAPFLQAFRPRVCIVSCAKQNRYGHPGNEALSRMKAAGGRVLCTMDCGQIKVTRRGENFFVTTAGNF